MVGSTSLRFREVTIYNTNHDCLQTFVRAGGLIAKRFYIPDLFFSLLLLTTDLPAISIVSSNASTSWVWLAWSDPPPDRYPLIVDKFIIYYAKQSNLFSPTALADLSQFWNQTVEPEKRNGNVTDLIPATEYVFRMVYVSGKFTSELSGPKSIATHDGELASIW